MTKYTKFFACMLIFMLLLSGFPISSYAATNSVATEKAIVFSKNMETIPILKEDTEDSEYLISISNQSEITLLDKGSEYTYISYIDPLTGDETMGYIQNTFIDAQEGVSQDSAQVVEETPLTMNENVEVEKPSESALPVAETKSEDTTKEQTASEVSTMSAPELNTSQMEEPNQTKAVVTSSDKKVPTLSGIALRNPTNIYSQTDENAKVLKNYPQGTLLKYKSLNTSWYECTVYINGIATTGYIKVSDVESPISPQTELTGIVKNNSLNVYSKASTSSNSLKKYVHGSVLKYRTFTSGWYQATVYISGKTTTSYIRKSDVENSVSPQKSLSGVTPAKVNVYSKASTFSTVLKSYAKGKTLKYKTFTSDWYQATIYVNGQAHTGYIKKSSMEAKSSATPASTGITYYVTGAASLNIRSGTGTRYKIVTSIKKGSKVTLYDTKGNWGKVTTSSGITGWASLTYLSKTAPSQGVKGKVIVIDAGHGGSDPGAIGSGSTYEKTLTLQTAKQLQSILTAAGAKVIMTRSGDTYPSLSDRVDISHKNNADAFISIHFNTSSSSSAKGIETYYWTTNVNELKLAEVIQEEVIKQTGLSSRGVKTGNFHVIRENENPAILIELGFLSNSTELKTVSTAAYQKKVATGIYKGLEKYFNL